MEHAQGRRPTAAKTEAAASRGAEGRAARPTVNATYAQWAMQTSLGPLQAKLAVGPTDDPAEREADRVADQVMRMPASAVGTQAPTIASAVGGVQRKCASCEEEERIRRKEAPGVEGGGEEAPAIVEDVLRSGGGRPLDRETRAFFEPRFGRDLGRVRVHEGSKADASARAVGALAYTVGSDVVFRHGTYMPGTAFGRRLLAHELTHVTQQHSAAGIAGLSQTTLHSVDTSRRKLNGSGYDGDPPQTGEPSVGVTSSGVLQRTPERERSSERRQAREGWIPDWLQGREGWIPDWLQGRERNLDLTAIRFRLVGFRVGYMAKVGHTMYYKLEFSDNVQSKDVRWILFENGELPRYWAVEPIPDGSGLQSKGWWVGGPHGQKLVYEIMKEPAGEDLWEQFMALDDGLIVPEWTPEDEVVQGLLGNRSIPDDVSVVFWNDETGIRVGRKGDVWIWVDAHAGEAEAYRAGGASGIGEKTYDETVTDYIASGVRPRDAQDKAVDDMTQWNQMMIEAFADVISSAGLPGKHPDDIGTRFRRRQDTPAQDALLDVGEELMVPKSGKAARGSNMGAPTAVNPSAGGGVARSAEASGPVATNSLFDGTITNGSSALKPKVFQHPTLPDDVPFFDVSANNNWHFDSNSVSPTGSENFVPASNALSPVASGKVSKSLHSAIRTSFVESDKDNEAEFRSCGISDAELPASVLHFIPAFKPGPRGYIASASPLSKKGGFPGGSRADSAVWSGLMTCVQGKGVVWVRGHLIHGVSEENTDHRYPGGLHGSGFGEDNLILISREFNNALGKSGSIYREVEGDVLDLVYNHNCVMWYDVEVEHHDKMTNPCWAYFAKSIGFEYGYYDPRKKVAYPPIYSGSLSDPAPPPSDCGVCAQADGQCKTQ